MSTEKKKQGVSIVTILEGIVAVIVIIGFIFGVTQWNDIQQYFWRQRIIGEWYDDGDVPIIFDGKGNFSSGGVLPAAGTYEFSDSSHIILQTSGILGVVGNQIFSVEFGKDQMTWESASLASTYTFRKSPDGEASHPAENIAMYKLTAWASKHRLMENRPGWTGYMVRISLTATSPFTTSTSKLNHKGKVVTLDGHEYEATLMSFDNRSKNDWYDGLNFYDGHILPANLTVTSVNHVDFGGWFVVPSTLKPKTLIFENVEPLDVSNIPDANPKLGQSLKDVQATHSIPYQDSESTAMKMQLSNPRITYFSDSNIAKLAIDADFTNYDMTADQQVYIDFDAYDSDGVLFTNLSPGCSVDGRDWNIDIEDDPVVVGPGQTVNGVLCFSLEGITDSALKNGTYVITGYKSDIGQLIFKINVPAK